MREQAKDMLTQIVEDERGETSADVVWQACHMLADIELAEGNTVDAYGHYTTCVEIIDSMRTRLRTEELIVDMLDLKPDFYAPLVSLAGQMGKSIEAIGWAEQAKSRAFLHLLGNTRLAVATDQDASLLQELDELDARIAILRRTIHADTPLGSPELITEWQDALNQQIATRERLRRRLKIANAEAASMVNVQPLDWLEVKALLVS